MEQVNTPQSVATVTGNCVIPEISIRRYKPTEEFEGMLFAVPDITGGRAVTFAEYSTQAF
jgi:hypothetical protein